MTNDLQQIAALLLKNRDSRADWGDISRLQGSGVFQRESRIDSLLCCLLDWQSDANVAWRKGEDLMGKIEQLGDPDDIWTTSQLLLKRSMGFEI